MASVKIEKRPSSAGTAILVGWFVVQLFVWEYVHALAVLAKLDFVLAGVAFFTFFLVARRVSESRMSFLESGVLAVGVAFAFGATYPVLVEWRNAGNDAPGLTRDGNCRTVIAAQTIRALFPVLPLTVEYLAATGEDVCRVMTLTKKLRDDWAEFCPPPANAGHLACYLYVVKTSAHQAPFTIAGQLLMVASGVVAVSAEGNALKAKYPQGSRAGLEAVLGLSEMLRINFEIFRENKMYRVANLTGYRPDSTSVIQKATVGVEVEILRALKNGLKEKSSSLFQEMDKTLAKPRDLTEIQKVSYSEQYAQAKRDLQSQIERLNQP